MDGRKLTKERNARWLCLVQLLAIFGKILGACHELAHGFEGGVDLRRDLSPGALKPENRGRAKGRNDGRQR